MISEVIQNSNIIKRKYSSNIYRMLKDNNISVITDEYLSEIRAYTLKIRNKDVIVIDSNLDEIEYNFVLCHEIYHILSHDDNTRCFSRIINNDRFELEANIFAVIFLGLTYVPNNSDICKIINKTLSVI